MTFGGELRCILLTAYFCLLVNVDALRPSHQMFSNNGMFFCLPVLNQYFIYAKDNVSCSRTQVSASDKPRSSDPCLSQVYDSTTE